ncbi:hypothetical protein BJ965_001925 [Streptomyces luteogriseus]|uniref:Uncharacterized protein n=1 Tax=Streptomyces luteogriseus TaxID=68233 RepID=A0A7W7DJL5_9ACTN|nr:hypothetical protein [Streptomyces luteogriseus]
MLRKLRSTGRTESSSCAGQVMGPSIPKPFEDSGKNGAYRLPEFDSQGNDIR